MCFNDVKGVDVTPGRATGRSPLREKGAQPRTGDGFPIGVRNDGGVGG